MLQRMPILDRGLLLYDPAFIPSAEADALFAHLRDSVPWKQEGTPGRKFPRLTAWYADPGRTYSYSGVTHTPLPWTPNLLAVKQRAEAAAGSSWNSLLLNL